MSTVPNPRSDQPSTYSVQDRSNKEEMARLQIQDEMMTSAMGGVLPDQPDLTIFQTVLDVGCGTGGWLTRAAQTYPHLQRLVGVDISSRMLMHARIQAQVRQVADRVEFQVMDALRQLEFPEESFDLVNQRLANSYLRTWDWPELLQNFVRVTRPGGVLRLTETDMAVESSSPALTRLFKLVLDAFARSGHFFPSDSRGVTGELARLLRQHGLVDVQTRPCVLVYRTDPASGQNFVNDMKYLFRTHVPFMYKWTQVPDDYEALYEQMVCEVQRPDFVAKANIVTAWGYKPPRSAR